MGWTALLNRLLASLERILCTLNPPMVTMESPSKVSSSALTMTRAFRQLGFQSTPSKHAPPPYYFRTWRVCPLTVANTSLIIHIHSLLIVDSTRSGKRMPDALSKTVPIWCAVINKAYLVRHGGLLEDAERKAWREHGELFSPPWISPSEWDEMHQRIDLWVERLLVSPLFWIFSSDLRVGQESTFVFDNLKRPLRPIWTTPASHVPTLTNTMYYPVVCVCASRMVEYGLERRMASVFTYVQGAGDDHETWSHVSHPKTMLFISNSSPEGPDTEHVLAAPRFTIILRPRESVGNDRTDYSK